MVSIARRGVRNFLAHAGIIEGPVSAEPTISLDMPDERCFVVTEHAGLVEPLSKMVNVSFSQDPSITVCNHFVSIGHESQCQMSQVSWQASQATQSEFDEAFNTQISSYSLKWLALSQFPHGDLPI